MGTKKVFWGLICVLVIFIMAFVFLAIYYIIPKYKSGTAESLESINGLENALNSFPSTGEIEYIRKTQAGTIGIFFMGKAQPDEVKRFCEKENCVVFPAKDYQHVWQDRLSMYKLSETFPVSYGEEDFHFGSPESLGNGRYRVLFLYMPNEQTFIGEVFFFR